MVNEGSSGRVQGTMLSGQNLTGGRASRRLKAKSGKTYLVRGTHGQDSPEERCGPWGSGGGGGSEDSKPIRRFQRSNISNVAVVFKCLGNP